MKKTITLFLCVIMYCSFLLGNRFDRSYRYPKNTNSRKWSKLETVNEKLQALQIPERKLKKMSTKDLIVTCVNYPDFINFLAFDTPQQGFDYLATTFNGIRELQSRSDAGKELLNFYLNTTTYSQIATNNRVNNNYWSLRRSYIDMLMSQSVFIEQLTQGDIQKLYNATKSRLALKINDEENYSKTDYQNSLLVMARTSKASTCFDKNAGNEPDDEFVKTGNISTSHLSRYLKSIVCEDPDPLKPSDVALQESLAEENQVTIDPYLACGNTSFTIEAYLRDDTYEFTNQQKQDYHDAYRNSSYGNDITLVDEASVKYNCGTYAWLMDEKNLPPEVTRDDLVIWLKHLDQIVYRSTCVEDVTHIPADHYRANRIVYQCGTGLIHTAIRDPYNLNRYLSKWGTGPVYSHELEDCPYTFNPNYQILYYIDNVSIPSNFPPPKPCIETSLTGGINEDVSCRKIIVDDASITNGNEIKLNSSTGIIVNPTFKVDYGSTLIMDNSYTY